MRRGDIYWVRLDPSEGRKTTKTKPAVVVSRTRANRESTGRGEMCTVVPITSNVSNVYSFQTFLPADRTGLRTDSKAQVEQLRSIGSHRLGELIGRVPDDLISALDAALRLHLAL